MGCVYVWTNKVNGKQYVGMSMRPIERQRDHIASIRSGKGGYAFHRAVRKHGLDAFTYEEVFLSEDRAELAAREIEEIARRGTFKDRTKGYNLTPGGEGATELTPECEARRVAGLRTAFACPETKMKRSAASIASMARPEVKAKQSASLKLTLARPEVKAMKSASMKSAAARPGYSAKQSVGVAVSWTRLGEREKRSARIKATWAARTSNLFCEGRVYSSMREAGNRLGLDSSTVLNRIRSTSERFRFWHLIPNHNDPACDAVEETWAIMQWAKENPDHLNVPDWARPGRPKHGVAPAWASAERVS